MDPANYIKQFGIIGKEDELNCDFLSSLLYTAYLSRFRIHFDEEEFYYFNEYHERIFNLLEDLREKNINEISDVFLYLQKINPHLVDIIIMSWSLPRINMYSSKKIYHNRYKENIKIHNPKIVSIAELEPIKNFCIETLTKTNYIPVHCMDFLWKYMDGINVEFSFVSGNTNYLHIIYSEEHNHPILELNMEYLLDLGIGHANYSSTTFAGMIKLFITNEEYINEFSKSESGINFINQMKKIHNNMKYYFGKNN